jgi:hypothetical protein
MQGYEWPDAYLPDLNSNSGDQTFDRDLLLRLASEGGDGPLIIPFLSREYLPLGFAWVRSAREVGIRRFALAATDAETAEVLESMGIPYFRVNLSAAIVNIGQYRSPAGFDGKGVAILHCRVEIVQFLVDHGIDVTLCDIDGFLLRNPHPYFSREADIIFQRVFGHPQPLKHFWGFTACCGFLSFRASPRVSAFLDRISAIQQEVNDDQLAFNLALLDEGVRWDLPAALAADAQYTRDEFITHAPMRIQGRTEGLGLSLEALPADTFWRHEFVPWNLETAVLAHPNAPRDLDKKLETFRRILGAKFESWLAGQ